MTLVRLTTAAGEPPSGPWSARHLTAIVVVHGMSASVIAAGWYGTSHLGTPARQVPWLGTAVVGLAFAMIGTWFWLRSGRRALSARLALFDIRQDIPVSARPAAGDEFIATETMRRYHRQGCQLTAGKAVAAAPRAEHERTGRLPCGMCLG